MNRKYAMTAAMHDKDGHGFLFQTYATRPDYVSYNDREMRVNLCKPDANKSAAVNGWAEITITQQYEKTQRNVSICLNRRQAEALRDLLNGAFGGSSRVASTIGGSMYSSREMVIVEDAANA